MSRRPWTRFGYRRWVTEYERGFREALAGELPDPTTAARTNGYQDGYQAGAELRPAWEEVQKIDLAVRGEDGL